MDLLALAKTIADRVEVAASRVVPVAVSIIDTHGNMILQHRMSGAPAFSLEISERKAYTSALVGMRTADLLPLAGPVPGHPGLWVAAGYSGHGNVLGLACGELVAGAILGRPAPELQLFDPGRLL